MFCFDIKTKDCQKVSKIGNVYWYWEWMEPGEKTGITWDQTKIIRRFMVEKMSEILQMLADLQNEADLQDAAASSHGIYSKLDTGRERICLRA